MDRYKVNLGDTEASAKLKNRYVEIRSSIYSTLPKTEHTEEILRQMDIAFDAELQKLRQDEQLERGRRLRLEEAKKRVEHYTLDGVAEYTNGPVGRRSSKCVLYCRTLDIHTTQVDFEEAFAVLKVQAFITLVHEYNRWGRLPPKGDTEQPTMKSLSIPVKAVVEFDYEKFCAAFKTPLVK